MTLKGRNEKESRQGLDNPFFKSVGLAETGGWA